MSGTQHGKMSLSDNEFATFNPEFATAVSNKLEHMSPRNESMPSIDPFEERVHEMTASYSEISIDSQTSPPQLDEMLSYEASPLSSDIEFGVKRKGQVIEESLPDSDSKRPDKLDLHKFNAKGPLDTKESQQQFQSGLGDLHLEGTVTQEGDLVLFVAEDLESKIKLSSPVTKKGDTPPFPGSRISTPCLYRQALMPQLPSLDPNILNDLETEVKRIATSVDTLTENLAGILHSVSALTVDCLETYRDAVCKTCDAVDSNIKSMYQLMAKCEELSKSMEPIYKLSEKIKGIKRLLDLFENATNP